VVQSMSLMPEIIDRINIPSGEDLMRQNGKALPHFTYADGYTLNITDFGNAGVKVELLHDEEPTCALILPPTVARECAKWLLRTIGQQDPRLPTEFPMILHRLIRHKDPNGVLKRGDKKKLIEALRILKAMDSKN
jgi:hypothetical protein